MSSFFRKGVFAVSIDVFSSRETRNRFTSLSHFAMQETDVQRNTFCIDGTEMYIVHFLVSDKIHMAERKRWGF